mmetsp:Transcript_71936/g.232747  ORF Transcript_71936/g.232747 Transcript_71936/m.232747 type:complete len:259 (-) Transcript_71936:311-1087(-)
MCRRPHPTEHTQSKTCEIMPRGTVTHPVSFGNATAHQAVNVLLTIPDHPDCGAGVAALRDPNCLRKRVSVLQVGWLLFPLQLSIWALLSHNQVLLLRLQHHVIAMTFAAPLHKFSCLRDAFCVLDALPLAGRLHRYVREDRPDHLRALLLDGSHLEAPEPVDAEPGTIFSALVKHWRCRLQSLLEHVGLSLVVGAQMQRTALFADHVRAADLHGGHPRWREQGARLIRIERLAEESILSLLHHGLLFLHKAPQLLHVG